MRVILNLDEKTLDVYQGLADLSKRSRKNYMEMTLENYIKGGNPITERAQPAVQVQDLNKQTNVIQPPQQPTTNYFLNTNPPPAPPKAFMTAERAYELEISATSHMGELGPLIKRIKTDPRLGPREKKNLDAVATAHKADKGMYDD